MTPSEAPATANVGPQPPIHPNTITLLRLPLGPLAVGFLVTETVWGIALAAVLALILEITDIADGKIARKYGLVSDFGKLFDPYSDSFSRFTLFLGLHAIGVADTWMIVAIFFRDSTVSFLRMVAATRNVVIAARQSGKIKAIVQGTFTQVAFLALLGERWYPALGPVPELSMWIITAVTMWSLYDYVQGSAAIMQAAWRDEPLPKRPE